MSGIVPLADGRDAFAARSLLADAAERTLDVQYYIWHNDTTGTLMFDALRRAADRGVRVRLLLDDNNTKGLDTILAALDTHPNIEVRLFNPFFHRQWRIIDFVFDFARVNRRMHNKSFTADNQVTIIGGRNMGDEYFGMAHDVLFVDLDVIAIGPVVSDVSTDFDRYWTSASAYPVGRVLPVVTADALTEVASTASRVVESQEATSYREALNKSPFVRDLLCGALAFEWAKTTMVSDDPGKGLDRARGGELLWSKLRSLVGLPTRKLELVSPYFVPGAAGVAYFEELTRAGVSITVLTNSVEATDVAAVHAGYAKRRKPLLEAGVVLFEMKAISAPVRGRMLFGGRKLFGGSGSSRSSLHAKTFAVDGTRVFVGSFNFDPRSARLNTELGFVIESAALARGITEAFIDRIPLRAYQVGLSKEGGLEWSEQIEGGRRTHRTEPGSTLWLRLGVSLMSKLPIEWLL